MTTLFFENMLHLMRFSVYLKKMLFAYRNNDIIAALMMIEVIWGIYMLS